MSPEPTPAAGIRFGRRHRELLICSLALLSAIAFCGLALAADTVVLVGGDRITGRILSRTAKRFRVQTPYGVLTIPGEKVELILREDGTEERPNAPAAPPPAQQAAPPPPPPPPPVTLGLSLGGQVFWQAWDRRVTPSDPTLRLELRIDSDQTVVWADSHLDEGEIQGAVVNAFSLAPGEVSVATREGVSVARVAARPGRVEVELHLPPETAGLRRVRLAYQDNEGTAEAPIWRNLAHGTIHVELATGSRSVIHVEQERGEMEYSGFPRKRMKNVESFRLSLRFETAGAP
jgi:hypothetical protein